MGSLVSRLQRREPRGQALVEFALLLPIFVLLLVGIADLGRGVYYYNTLSNAAREADRLAIVDQDCSAIVNDAVNRAVSVGLAASDVTVWIWDPSAANAGDFSATSATLHRRACGSTPGTAECPQSSTDAEILIGCTIEVTISHQYTPVTPILGNLIGSITMTATTRLPVESTCDTSFLQPPSTCRTPAS